MEKTMNIASTQTIHLIGMYGKQKAKKVCDLTIGDVLIWNYGYTSTLEKMEPTKSGRSINCFLRSGHDGIVRKRLLRASSLVAVQ